MSCHCGAFLGATTSFEYPRRASSPAIILSGMPGLLPRSLLRHPPPAPILGELRQVPLSPRGPHSRSREHRETVDVGDWQRTANRAIALTLSPDENFQAGRPPVVAPSGSDALNGIVSRCESPFLVASRLIHRIQSTHTRAAPFTQRERSNKKRQPFARARRSLARSRPRTTRSSVDCG